MKHVSLIVFGAGKVGRALIRQLADAEGFHAVRHELDLRVAAWCDHDGALVDEKGVPPAVLRAAAESKAQGVPLGESEYGYHQSELSAIIDVAGCEGTIVADVTATETTVPALELALRRGYAVATANKAPLAGPQVVFNHLTRSGRFRYESTVGSAVPVIETTLGLMRAADRIDAIRGALSGTLGFLSTGLHAGRGFSELVREAMERGYTEPDPRVDLSGVDVARKALILARTLGWTLELTDVATESLVPEEMVGSRLSDFLDRLHGMDDGYRTRVAAAGAEGSVLRYVAEVKNGRANVGLRAVPSDSPLGRLQGNDNLVAFNTRYYPDSPLVLQGRGAGVEAAAAGVHADIVALGQGTGG
jgi:homoserine dehydrogenase